MKSQNQSFDYWKNLYNTDQLYNFNFNTFALLWLKIKSIRRRKILNKFIKTNDLSLKKKNIEEQFEELYNLFSDDVEKNHKRLNTFIRAEHSNQKDTLDIQQLISELYKLRYFSWGGNYKNQLDRYLVDKYVKVYQSYDNLVSKLNTDISDSVQGYVLCSWYNHWSSILIEHIFKAHPIVLPSIGRMKKVDFFMNGIPFDLKVTYLPMNFVEKQRKVKGLRSELVELKKQAKKIRLPFSTYGRPDDIYHEIIEKMRDKNNNSCKNILQNISRVRLNILNEVKNDPKKLIQNLYKNQGELRFDASNRLFLVLIDTGNFDNSWQLKRNFDLLKSVIQAYLDNFKSKHIDNLKISFNYEIGGQLKKFTSLSDILFIIIIKS